MTNYYDWNEAILQYAISGLQLGSRVFLSTDEDALIEAGGLIDSPPPADERVDSFIAAVQTECVVNGQIDLSRIQPQGQRVEEPPPYLAFLAATVLAAYRMGEDEDISPNNYFTCLNDLLGLPDTTQGRPQGMVRGSEESLWLSWAVWLTRQGYLASAKQGSGSQKYISYPISQTLLRETDKNSLWQHFTNRGWPRNLDVDAIIGRILRDRQSLTRHLDRMISDTTQDSSRREGLFEGIYEVYELWIASEPEGGYSKGVRVRRRELSAGLYRQVDPFANASEYHVLPQQARRVRAQEASVLYEENKYPLIPERLGWYRPLWRIGSSELDEGVRVELIGADQLKKMVLPARDFWILVPDPLDPYSGIYGSWSRPSLGTPFVLLCKETLTVQVDYLKSEGMIKWREGDPVLVWKDADWLEYRDVMVISQGWAGLDIENENLLRGLRPTDSIGISFRGGIREPRAGGWLIGYGPAIVVHSFYSKASIEVIEPISNEVVVEQRQVDTNVPVQLDLALGAGTYVLVARVGPDRREQKETPINIVDWLDVSAAQISQPRAIQIGSGKVFGALVEAEPRLD